MSDLKLSPLYTIFEKHLYDFQVEISKILTNEKKTELFISRVVEDYFEFLNKHKIIVPYLWRTPVEEELRDQVRQMLRKKTYGCLSVGEFVTKESSGVRKIIQKRSKKKYSKLF